MVRKGQKGCARRARPFTRLTNIKRAFYFGGVKIGREIMLLFYECNDH